MIVFRVLAEPADFTSLIRSSLLDRLSSPIAVAESNKNLPSEPIDKATATDNKNNQNTRPNFEANKEDSSSVQQQL
ncbi:hypothetical protein PGT21_016937 [Puccinia graminis f. sp. tritici]|uniref:Uncharacterized protein n=1 Tax=Puccinia graminis f. sp. tritici TaxID=56615 RepID=A0A5B0RPY5_PUCGR|nr:hypothetical protein PGT21_016937 [Puccinia graminis f. sp. tritici]KAA1126893.1 hypothetical protein PGTUg99_030433 [Puccinia graminis f. sp. tritici]